MRTFKFGETDVVDCIGILGDGDIPGGADADAASCARVGDPLGLSPGLRAWRVAWARDRFLASDCALLASFTACWSSSSCFQAYNEEEGEDED